MDEDGVWRTICGRRVFIKNGQNLTDAMKESGKFDKEVYNNKIRKPQDITKKELEKIKVLSQLIDEDEFKLGIEKSVFEIYGLNKNFPNEVSNEQFSKMESQTIYRGISANSEEQAKMYFKRFKKGDIYIGKNNSGSGIWFSYNKNIANVYKNGEMGTSAKKGKNSFLIEAKIRKNAKLINKNDLPSKKERILMYDVKNDNILSKIVYDDGLYATMLGYDGIIDEVGFTNKIKNVSILNREILVIKNENK